MSLKCLHKLRVCFLTTEVDSSQSLCDVLQKETTPAYQFSIVTSFEALKKLQQHSSTSPDVMICELDLSGSNTVDAVLNIKYLFPDSFLVLVTAIKDFQVCFQQLSNVADEWLIKETSTQSIKHLLEGRLSTVRVKQLNQLTEAVFFNAQEGIFITQLDGTIIDVNPSFTAITGFELSDVIGKTPRILSSGNQSPSFYQEMWKSLVKYGCWQGEVINKHKRGHLYSESLSVISMKYDDQDKYIAFLTDVSEIKEQRKILAEKNKALEGLLEEREQEQLIARKVYDHIVTSWQKELSFLTCFYQPASSFSGDLVLWHEIEDGSFYFASFDATGHGLSAAITLMPITEIFSRMVKKNRSLNDLVMVLNRKLGELLPVDRFVSAVLLRIDSHNHQYEIWNGASPDVYLVDKQSNILERIVSQNMALGIIPDNSFMPVIAVGTTHSVHSLILFSDGILDQFNSEKNRFGVAGVVNSIAQSTDATTIADEIINSFNEFCGDMPMQDDVTVCQINLDNWRKKPVNIEVMF